MSAVVACDALYFNGNDAAAVAVTLHAAGETLVARADALDDLRWPRAALRPDTPAGAPRPVVRTPEGAVLILPTCDALAALGIAQPRPTLAERIAGGHALSAFAALVLVAVMAFGVIDLLPRAITLATPHLPHSVMVPLGDQVLRQLDQRVFGPSRASAQQRAAVQARFQVMAGAAGLPRVRLLMRDGRAIGANAIALPGGTVVVTDQLLELLGPTPQLDAVLAHELGHLVHNDAARRILQRAGVGGVLSLLMSDQAGFARNLAAAAPTLLLDARHSREVEAEADSYAFDLLRKLGRPPTDLADALARFEASLGPERRAPKYLSSHPQTPDRIEAARRAN